MEAIIAHPAKGAKRSPARKTAVKPAPAVQPTADDDSSRSPNSDEMTVAIASCEQLLACYEAHCSSMTAHGSELLRSSAEYTSASLPGQIGIMGIGNAFLHAASMVAGAIAIERASNPTHPVLAELEPILDVLNTAALGFVFEAEPCEGLAAGLRAGARPFRDRPQPPIRRVEGFTREQLITVIEFVAGHANTLNDLLKQAAQTPNLPWEAANLIPAAQALAQYIGAATDDALGGDISGDFEHWTYGPNFADAGKGDAA